jgi:XTP/dITP diphosphohydrolase
VKLYYATTNAGKIREFRAAAANGIEIAPMPGLERIPACAETGLTFEENAEQKARHYAAYTSDYLFADDSGLEVDALDGQPGVYSARFAGPSATDEQNNALLIEQLAWATDRTARYVCVIALAKNGEIVRTFRGEVEGSILNAPRGNGGFGYDPLFYFKPFKRSFAELSQEEKQSVSHRGRALRAMEQFLQADISSASENGVSG